MKKRTFDMIGAGLLFVTFAVIFISIVSACASPEYIESLSKPAPTHAIESADTFPLDYGITKYEDKDNDVVCYAARDDDGVDLVCFHFGDEVVASE